MLHNATDLGAKTRKNAPSEYHCEKCDYTTCKTSDWKRHLKTKKHNATKMLHNATDLAPKTAEKAPDKDCGVYCCECGKSYKHHSSYYRHKSKCTWTSPIEEKVVEESETSSKNDQISLLISTVKTLIENGTNNNNTTNIGGNNSNSFNNNFNINLFLNDKCANALSIQDFAEKLRITMNDLSSMKTNEPKAITSIIEQNLSGLALTERPMHNHEKKWYVKDKQEGWEDKSGEKIVKEVKSSIARKSVPVFVENNPDWHHSDKKGAEYAEIVSVTMSELAENKGNKVLKGLENTCTIDVTIT
tara:strand:- start:98 stop:1003 length:906 start_codon:yes stop_codon:yes gene_type:complete